MQELKYSLRSVSQYLPWINKIYIVIDNQVPSWLNTEHPKIKIIDHKDILPADALPTFNSNNTDGNGNTSNSIQQIFSNSEICVGRNVWATMDGVVFCVATNFSSTAPKCVGTEPCSSDGNANIYIDVNGAKTPNILTENVNKRGG